MKRRIVYVSGTRADFGLFASTLKRLREDSRFELLIYATGMHLSPLFGETVREIEAQGFDVRLRAPTPVETGSGAEMASGLALALEAFTQGLLRDRPDLVLVLGDRGEMLAGALAAIHLNIPVAHVHGGERSGTVDESIRHAVSKLAHLHLVSTSAARERLIRMGERPEQVFVCGAPGLDALLASPPPSRAEVFAQEGLDPARKTALMVYHPVVQNAEAAGEETLLLLDLLRARGLQALILAPNSDAGSDRIRTALEQARAEPDWRLLTHLPRERYVGWMARADVMVGNSSSGVIEAASFGTPVVNVGERQAGRERNANTFDAPIERGALNAALDRALAAERFDSHNVYGDGAAGPRICEVLASPLNLPGLLNKLNAY